jgi:hypothetical protein
MGFVVSFENSCGDSRVVERDGGRGRREGKRVEIEESEGEGVGRGVRRRR